MRFVHLAPVSRLRRIRRNGIRTGGGLWGPGVYAVPLFHYRERTLLDPDAISSPSMISTPISSTRLWSWIGGHLSHGGRGPLAGVIFDGARIGMTVDALFLCELDWAEAFLSDLARDPITCQAPQAHQRAKIRKEQASRSASHIKLRFRSLRTALAGRLLHHYLRYEGAFCPSPEYVEFIFPSLVPARTITAIVPALV